MINPAIVFKIKGLWDKFAANHPKFPKFLQAVISHPMEADTVIEITVRRPNGDLISSNVKLTASDLELFEQLKEFGMNT